MNNRKLTSFRWECHFVKESKLKTYKNINLKKLRPILIISDNEKLINRCLVVELSTSKQNENSIFWYRWQSKKTNTQRESWILPDRIHTINRNLLNNQNRSSHKLNQQIKQKILDFVRNMLEDKN